MTAPVCPLCLTRLVQADPGTDSPLAYCPCCDWNNEYDLLNPPEPADREEPTDDQ